MNTTRNIMLAIRSLLLPFLLLSFSLFAQDVQISAIKESFGEAAPDLNKRLEQHIKINPDGPNRIGYITIDKRNEEISQSTWLYVRKALEYYKQHKPIFIILKLNTPGGQVYPAQEISDALYEMDINENVPVVAFIDNWAMSAGAMIAYSCRFITGTTSASMGAAEPIVQSAEGDHKTASEKINSAIRADFSNRAHYFDRNADLAVAMVDKDRIIVKRDGKIIRLDSADQIRRQEPNPDEVISPAGKLLTLDATEMMRYGLADLILNKVSLPEISEQQKESGKWPADKMLLFQYPFFKNIPNASIDAYVMDWKTQFFVFLASPIVSSLLMMGLLMGTYIEFSTPGFGVAGTIALLCLLLIGISSYSLQIANWLEAILLLSGLAFLALEFFVFPTAGLLGVIGAILAIAGLFGLLLPGVDKVRFDWDTSTFNAAGEFFFERLALLSGALLLSFIMMALLARYIAPRFKALNRFVLKGNEQDVSDGYYAGATRSDLPKAGEKGIVVSALRPSGRVRIGDREYQATSYGNFIEEGINVHVVGYEGSIVIVAEERA